MILDFGDGFYLRQARADDHAALCTVCLRTGDAGKDATEREDDPALLGLIYAVPYQVFDPDFAFVVDGPAGISGYLFGALDTLAFNARLASEWYPGLQSRVTDPGFDSTCWRGSDWARHLIHHPDFAVPDFLAAYPSHGHIDLLPEARGRGIGRRSMAFLERCLVARGSSGLWLPVHPLNRDALRFYVDLGFRVLHSPDMQKQSIYLAKRLGS